MSAGRAAHARPLRRVDHVADGADLAVAERSNRWIRWGTVIASFLAFVVLFGLVATNALIVRNQGELDRLDREIGELTRTTQTQAVTIAELEAPQRIRTFAVEALGMIEPSVVTHLEPISEAELIDP